MIYGTITPRINIAYQFYFDRRSDNFTVTNSTNGNNARLDPEAIRVSNDGSKIYISDEYGPYVYQFDRATGQRNNTYSLPSTFNLTNLSSLARLKSAEIPADVCQIKAWKT